MIIKLSDLRGLRAKMTPGPWGIRPNGVDIDGDLAHEDGSAHLFSALGEVMFCDAPGVIATHNAADALIGRDEACQALEDARLAPMTPGYREAVDTAAGVSLAAYERYLAARARVTR